MSTISNTDDMIDSRDVIERIEELEEEETLTDYERRELTALVALAKEASDYSSDWEYGEALIRDSHFVEYAEELAIECGLVEDTNQWPKYCIDWQRAASDLQMDYTLVDFDGANYWIRST